MPEREPVRTRDLQMIAFEPRSASFEFQRLTSLSTDQSHWRIVLVTEGNRFLVTYAEDGKDGVLRYPIGSDDDGVVTEWTTDPDEVAKFIGHNVIGALTHQRDNPVDFEWRIGDTWSNTTVRVHSTVDDVEKFIETYREALKARGSEHPYMADVWDALYAMAGEHASMIDEGDWHQFETNVEFPDQFSKIRVPDTIENLVEAAEQALEDAS